MVQQDSEDNHGKASSGCSIDKITVIKNNLNKEKQQSNGK